MKRHNTGATGTSTVYERLTYEQREQLKDYIAKQRKGLKGGMVFKMIEPRKSDKPKEEQHPKGEWRKRENCRTRKRKNRQTMRECLIQHQKFAEFVAMLMFDKDYNINYEANRELITRQLHKLGYVDLRGDRWLYYELEEENNESD